MYSEKVKILYTYSPISLGEQMNERALRAEQVVQQRHQLLPISISNYAKINEIILNQKCARKQAFTRSAFSDTNPNEINKIVICQMINDRIATEKRSGEREKCEGKKNESLTIIS